MSRKISFNRVELCNSLEIRITNTKTVSYSFRKGKLPQSPSVQVPLVALPSAFAFLSLSPLEAVKLSRIIPLPTAIAIKLELNTRLQLVDFTRVRQDEIEKSSRSEQSRGTDIDERVSNFECDRY